ncbi:MAG: DUF4159 domain-containing protein [Pseudomonadales bacterium]|nr:DUF4159 domain-containing protein [Pseudomonadales bacterium]
MLSSRSGKSIGILAAVFALLLAVAGSAQAQRLLPDVSGMAPLSSSAAGYEFYFARLIYGAGSSRLGAGFRGRGRFGSSWTTDMPEAEHFFMSGVNRLTRLHGSPASRYSAEGAVTINLRDGTVFDYPWLYAVEVGYWTLDTEEADILREYLLRGGFLMVDDFHGTQEWQGFVSTMQKVFPDRPIIDIPDDDEVFHVLYDLDEKIQIPGLAALYNGQTWERDGYDPAWRGIYDDAGRLIVAINHNMDLGDAWEHADTPGYPEPMTALAYRFAVNYVVYSMTH